MDRFKFRVWDKQNECYAYSNNSDVDVLYIETDGELTYGVYNNDIEDMYYTPESEVIVEQCTGLNDKNGKLIYEGDFLKDHNGIWQVLWDEKEAAFYLYNKKRDFYLSPFIGEFEVIGNIHENADLLGEE